jgi:hypothetical protein
MPGVLVLAGTSQEGPCSDVIVSRFCGLVMLGCLGFLLYLGFAGVYALFPLFSCFVVLFVYFLYV